MQTIRTFLMHMDETARMGDRMRFARTIAESIDVDIVCRPCSRPGCNHTSSTSVQPPPP